MSNCGLKLVGRFVEHDDAGENIVDVTKFDAAVAAA
jgi:hypothetical protein